jgi:hypothetical protein
MLETAEDLTAPRILQLSIFLPNRIGALQRVVTRLEALDVDIRAIAIVDSADHAVVRLIVNRSDVAKKALADAGYAAFETELLGVALPDGEFGIRKLLGALLVAEINVHYVYGLLVRVDGHPVVAVHVDSPDSAGRVLRKAGAMLVGQDEIDAGDG